MNAASTSHPAPGRSTGPDPLTTIVVSGLPGSTHPWQVVDLCEPMGHVERVVVRSSADADGAGKTAWVTFGNGREARHALEALQGRHLGEAELRASRPLTTTGAGSPASASS